MRRSRTRQTGVAMLLVLTTIAVAAVLGLSYLCATTVKLAGSTNLLRASRSRYLAESGVDHALHLVRHGDQSVLAATADNPLGPYQADGSDDSYVCFARQVGAVEYVLTSRATCRGLTRTTSARIRLHNDYRTKLMALNPIHYWRLGEAAGPVAQDQLGAAHGTYHNGVQLGRWGAILGDPDTAAYFDGLNDYVDLGGEQGIVPGDKKASWLCWFRADDFAVSDACLISRACGTKNNDYDWTLSVPRTPGQIRLQFRLRINGSVATCIAASEDLQPGQWYMAAATFDDKNIRLFLNGILVGMTNQPGSIILRGNAVAWIGNNPPNDISRPFHGLIDEVAIFRSALRDEDVLSLYEARVASAEILSWQE